MNVLSITRFVDGDADTVQRHVEQTAADATIAHTVEVTPVAPELTRVVVRLPWDDRDETSRRDSTLAAARFSSEVFGGVAAA